MALKELFDLTGKIALITGGSRGLGLQIAEGLGEYGAVVVLTARKQNELDEARAILAPDAPAVFKMNGRMCEPATHRRWAQDIIDRAALYGHMPPSPGEALHYQPASAS